MSQKMTKFVNLFIKDLKYSEYAQRDSPVVGKLDLQHTGNVKTPERLTAFLRKVNIAEITNYRYAQDRDLLDKISSKEGLPKDNILITAGADSALHHIAEAFLTVGKKALIPIPSFPRYEFHTKVVGAKPVFVNVYGLNQDYKLQTLEAKMANDSYQVIFLDSPNNPTGEIFEEDKLRGFLKTVKESIVVLDQALSGYFEDSVSKLVLEFSNLIVVKSFSKFFGLPGLRIGYLIASKELMPYLLKTVSPYAVSSISILAAKIVLKDKHFIEHSIKQVHKSLHCIKKNLKIRFSNSQGPIILLNGEKKTPNLGNQLAEQGILVLDGKNFRGLEATNTVRAPLTDYQATLKLVNAISSLRRSSKSI